MPLAEARGKLTLCMSNRPEAQPRKGGDTTFTDHAACSSSVLSAALAGA